MKKQQGISLLAMVLMIVAVLVSGGGVCCYSNQDDGLVIAEKSGLLEEKEEVVRLLKTDFPERSFRGACDYKLDSKDTFTYPAECGTLFVSFFEGIQPGCFSKVLSLIKKHNGEIVGQDLEDLNSIEIKITDDEQLINLYNEFDFGDISSCAQADLNMETIVD